MKMPRRYKRPDCATSANRSRWQLNHTTPCDPAARSACIPDATTSCPSHCLNKHLLQAAGPLRRQALLPAVARRPLPPPLVLPAAGAWAAGRCTAAICCSTAGLLLAGCLCRFSQCFVGGGAHVVSVHVRGDEQALGCGVGGGAG